MIPDEPMVPGAPLRLRSILLWQTVAIGCGIGVQVYLDRGAPFSVFLGAFLMSGSLVLSRLAFRYAEEKTTFLGDVLLFFKTRTFSGPRDFWPFGPAAWSHVLRGGRYHSPHGDCG